MNATEILPNYQPVPDSQIEKGTPNFLLDGIGAIISIPRRLTYLNNGLDNHGISTETEKMLNDFLKKYNLKDVKVRYNAYTPMNELGRTLSNDKVGIIYRLTFGLLRNTFDTLLPGRIWGGSYYNPWSNTIHLYGEDKSVALLLAGQARDYEKTVLRGTYAVASMLPLVSLYQNLRAFEEGTAYLKDNNLKEDQREAIKKLAPIIAPSIGGPLLGWANLPAVFVGHCVGRVLAKMA